jgi:hypothetical protein
MIRTSTAKVKLLQGAAEYHLDLPEFFRSSTDIVLFLQWVTDLQVVYIVYVEISINLTVITFRHHAREQIILAVLDALFVFFDLCWKSNGDNVVFAIKL